MGRVTNRIGAGRRLVNFDFVPTATDRSIDIDTSKFSKLLVLVYAVGAGALADNVASVDLLQPDGTPYTSSLVPGNSPTPPVLYLGNTAQFLPIPAIALRMFPCDVMFFNTVRLRYRNASAGTLPFNVDIWAI